MRNDRSNRPTRQSREAEPEALRSTRERLVAWLDVLAEEAYAQALYEWARGEDGPMPTRGDARSDAEDQARLLLEGLGEWGAMDPGLLDVQEAADESVRRRRRARNAHLRRSDRPDWWDFL